ncbi:hypothetical protein ACP26C_23870 (plasmid) [Franconibacter helveticus 513]|uniref:hypothetical protein n=1 Tax=Franconibacter TaxID=1649295 RepID=UPI0004655261|nr:MULTISPECIES: hypothetical protein [Franconibacter]
MTLSYKEVKEDVHMIISSLDNEEREIPSTLHSLKICSIVPFVSVLLNAVTFVVVCALANGRAVFDLNNIRYLFNDWGALPVYAAIAIGIAQTLLFVTQVTLYFSVPNDVRQKSLVLSKVREKLKNFLIIYFGLILITSFISTYSFMWVFATPAIMFVSIFIINFIASIEVAKYGLTPVLTKLSAVCSKI